MTPHLPSMSDPGHDAHQIRRGCERAHVDVDHAVLRAQRAGFPDLAAALIEVRTRLDLIRMAAEVERRQHTPEEFRARGLRRDYEAHEGARAKEGP